MKCYKCGKEEFKTIKVREAADFKDMKGLEFLFDVKECEGCSTRFSTPEFKKAKLVAMTDAYKKAQGLYTSKEVRAFREEKFDMTQEEFAQFLHVGVSSLRRWEGTGVQDDASNELIKTKCDENWAILNQLGSWQRRPADEYSGFQKFDPDKFKAIVSHIVEHAKSPLYFFKALFFIDADHYMKTGKGITGLSYACLEHGPIPKRYDVLVDYLIKIGNASLEGKHNLVMEDIFDSQMFSTSENESIENIRNLLKEKGAQYIYKKSHEQEVFKRSDYLDEISYKEIVSLTL